MSGDFEQRVQQQMARLQTHAYAAIERDVAQKRIAWCQERHETLRRLVRPSPRQAFELLFRYYMGLALEDLPIVSETDTEIIWRSLNPCPTLEAAQRLALDTRRICRAAYERSTQAFLSQLDPQLRFLRSYTEIRPYAAHCLEMIVRVSFDDLLRLALAEASASQHEGHPGTGAVVALGQRILAQTHDTTLTQDGRSLHAEASALRQAARALGDSNLRGAILVSTREPCPACASLAEASNLTTLVYTASMEEATPLGNISALTRAQKIVDRSSVMLEVICLTDAAR
jgi:tRNA(Arg) A34 adenosine deaminase TadA